MLYGLMVSAGEIAATFNTTKGTSRGFRDLHRDENLFNGSHGLLVTDRKVHRLHSYGYNNAVGPKCLTWDFDGPQDILYTNSRVHRDGCIRNLP